MIENVYDLLRLTSIPECEEVDEALNDFPIDSVCGQACDKVVRLALQLEAACGDSAPVDWEQVYRQVCVICFG